MKQILFLLFVAFSLGCFSRIQPEKTGMEGQQLPPLQFLQKDSTTIFNTNEILNGRPIVFFLLSAGCPYCRAQLRAITANINSVRQIDIYIVTHSSVSDIQKIYNEFQLDSYNNIKILFDNKNFFESKFNAFAVPYFAIYNKEKELISAFAGRLPVTQIVQMTKSK